MKTKLYYLATPYSHPEPKMREARFIMACLVAGELMDHGLHVFSPISHSHPIACQWNLPKGWDFWGKQDLVMMDRCDEMIVIMAPGWDESKGIKEEMIYAEFKGMPIHMMPYPVRGDFVEDLEP